MTHSNWAIENLVKRTFLVSVIRVRTKSISNILIKEKSQGVYIYIFIINVGGQVYI